MAIYNSANNSLQSFNKTLFEAVVVADQYGNMVGPANPSGMAVDAFGRARTSTPLTLFESFHRYQDNGKVSTSNTSGGTYVHNANTSMIEMTVDSTSGAKVIRETNRVFAYQPGKSLQILTTFCMAQGKAGLRQRAGYFTDYAGIFLELDGTDLYIVKRSNVTGTLTDTRVAKADWTFDKLDGTGPSNKTLDITKSQIFFIDVEWLGVGSVRCGFVIDGQFVHVHTFNHANDITTTYMTTACLPGRVEIENTGGMTGTATYKQACFSVISEGGYQLRGRPRSFGTEPNAQVSLSSAGTYYPVIALRLHPDKKDAIAIPTNISLVGVTNGNYRYKLISGATVTGAVWANTYSGNTSCVQYNSNTAATISGGTDLITGLFSSTTQASGAVTLPGEDLFGLQFERNSLANTMTTMVLAIAPGTATSNVLATINWQEIT